MRARRTRVMGLSLSSRSGFEEGDDPLLDLFGRRAVAIVEVQRKHRMRRHSGPLQRLLVLQLNGLEPVAELALQGLEARLGDEAIAFEAQADHRQVFLLE